MKPSSILQTVRKKQLGPYFLTSVVLPDLSTGSRFVISPSAENLPDVADLLNKICEHFLDDSAYLLKEVLEMPLGHVKFLGLILGRHQILPVSNLGPPSK